MVPAHTLALTMIVLNEARSIQKTIESCRLGNGYVGPIDCVVLLDTGSVDETLNLALYTCDRLNIQLHIYQEPFVDFATTRNRALDFAQKHAVFSLQLSGDEYLRGPAAIHLNKFLTKTEIDILHLDVRSERTHFSSTRVVRNASPWRWTGVVHEYMRHPDGAEMPPFAIDGLWIDHEESDPERKMARFERDAALLENELKKKPNDPRSIFYLAQTYECLGRLENAHELYIQRIAIEGFAEERSDAAFRAGTTAEKMGLPWKDTLPFYLKAHSLDPRVAEPLFAIAAYYAGKQEDALAFLFGHRAYMLPYPKGRLLNVIREIYDWRAADLVAVAACRVGEKVIGLEAGAKALKNAPEKERERIGKNLSLYKNDPQ